MVKLIAAIAQNNVIGKDNDLAWNLPADMRFFSETTKGHIVLMGRKNWQSIPHAYCPLPDRLNLVVTRDPHFRAEGAEVFHTVEDALAAYAADERDFFIIGGGQLYAYALAHDLVREMFLTHIDQAFEGDTFFPEIDRSKWQKHLLFAHPKDEKHRCSFSVYHYRSTAVSAL